MTPSSMYISCILITPPHSLIPSPQSLSSNKRTGALILTFGLLLWSLSLTRAISLERSLEPGKFLTQMNSMTPPPRIHQQPTVEYGCVGEIHKSDSCNFPSIFQNHSPSTITFSEINFQSRVIKVSQTLSQISVTITEPHPTWKRQFSWIIKYHP